MVRDISAIPWAAGLSQGTAKSGLGLGSRALQKGAEGCVGGPGALLLGCEKWECFIHSRWKYRQRYYLTFVFFVVLTNNFKCSYHVFHHIQFPCTDILFLAGCCLPSSASTALINPLSPHTSLWLNTPTMRRNWMSLPFLTGVLSQVPEMSHLSYSSLPLLPETHHSAQGCLHLLFPGDGEGRGQSIIWEKTWQSPIEAWFLVYHRQKPVSCRALMSGICIEHARSNVICPVTVAACSPCNSHSLSLPAPSLLWSWAGQWGLMPFPSVGCNAV